MYISGEESVFGINRVILTETLKDDVRVSPILPVVCDV